VRVTIHSRYAEITFETVGKHGFSDVPTLHAVVAPPRDSEMAGTEFILTGLSDEEVQTAKHFFLRYSDERELEHTRYGSVLERRPGTARIYVNGLRVAEEPNFLFSYNITSLTMSLRAALNRERSNVGRQAYSDRVKALLLASTGPAVAAPLAEDLAAHVTGRSHDETAWIDVGLHACRILNTHQAVVFVTAEQMHFSSGMIANARDDGYRVIVVPDTISQRLPRLSDLHGDALRDLDEYREEWNRSFQYDFLTPEELSDAEREIFELRHPLIALFREEARRVRDIRISQTMRISTHSNNEALGVWEAADGWIVVKREQLGNPEAFLGTLLHELAHAMSGAFDMTEEFEDALTDLLGRTGLAAASRIDVPHARR
jgi:hypothetical protein